MFLIFFTIFVANICLVPYYFIDYVEYFLINAMIPLINNIYSMRNKKRILEIKVYDGLQRIDLFRNHISSSDSSDEDIHHRINEISEQLLINNNKLLNSDTDSDMPDLISISDSDNDSNCIITNVINHDKDVNMTNLIMTNVNNRKKDNETEDGKEYDETEDGKEDDETEDDETEDDETEDEEIDYEQTKHDNDNDNLIIIEDVE